MSEPRYNNRQIEKMLSEQSADIKEHMDLKTAPLLTQALKTNGRVTRNEQMIYLATGALIILTPVFSWFILDYIALKERLPETIGKAVDESVYRALDNYQWEVINPIIDK